MKEVDSEYKISELVKLERVDINRKYFQVIHPISRSIMPIIAVNSINILEDIFDDYFELDKVYSNRIKIKSSWLKHGDIVRIVYNRIMKKKVFILEEN